MMIYGKPANRSFSFPLAPGKTQVNCSRLASFWRIGLGTIASQPGPPRNASAAAWSLLDSPGWAGSRAATRRPRPPSAAAHGLGRPATPLSSAGIPARTLEQLAPLLAELDLTLVQGGGAATRPSQERPALQPGAVLALPLLVGDVELTAIGTCTEVIGDRVWGFGHPFANEGGVNLPMGSGLVHSVVPNLANSFKIGAMVETVGAIRSDYVFGVVGIAAEKAPVIPISLRVVAPPAPDRTLRFSSVSHPRFTPLLAATAAHVSLRTRHEPPEFHTVDFDLTLRFDNGRSVRVSDSLARPDPSTLAEEISLPMFAAYNNPFGRVGLAEVSGTMTVREEVLSSEIRAAQVRRTKLRPGDVLQIQVLHRPFRGLDMPLDVEMPLPENLPDGEYRVVVGNWRRWIADESALAPSRFAADSLDQMFDVIDVVSAVRRDCLYVRLIRLEPGVAVGRVAMPSLPSSRRQVLLSGRPHLVSELVRSEVRTFPSRWVFDGDVELTIHVNRAAAPQ